jgi:cytoskeletal protein RodZ
MSETSDKFINTPPGLLLQQARKKKRLRFKKLSSELKIPESYIRAIESGEYSLIPGGIPYIRGYMRSYARIVEIDPDLVVRSYEAESPSKRERRLYLNDYQSKKSLAKLTRKIRNYILGISMLGLILFFSSSSFSLDRFKENSDQNYKVALLQ